MTAAELTLRLSQTWVNPTNKCFKDYTGRVFGRLTVIRYIGQTEAKCSNSIWYCQCTCGKFKAVTRRCLKSGIVRSCGCLLRETVSKRMSNRVWRATWASNKTHGLTNSPEYGVWRNMKGRCLDPKHKSFSDYGGRGIAVCERWLKFENFYADMGERPTTKHSIDRIDGRGHYEPGNCRWATMTQQIRNRCTTVFVTHNGETKPLGEWVEITGLPYSLLHQRIKRCGWSPERAFSTASPSAALAPRASP